MALRSIRRFVLLSVLLSTPLTVSCTGGGGSYVSNDPSSAVSTTVTGKSDTSGISAGSAIEPPSASPTRAP